MWTKQRCCWQLQSHVWITNFRGWNWKTSVLRKSSYFFMVLWSGRSCEEMCGATLWVSPQDDSTTPQSIYSMHMTTTSKKMKWNLLENCHKYALKLFWKAYTWHVLEDLIFYGQWTNLHDRSRNGPKLVTNDYLVWYLTSITHVNTNHIVMWVTLQNNAGWDCFKTPILRETLRTPNLLQVEHCVTFGSHTFVPISWMCKKQTSVSHSSTESEIISLDAGLRLDGFPAPDLWDLIVLVLENKTQNHDRTWRPVVCPHTNHGRQQSGRVINDLDNVDLVPSNVQFSHQEALLYIFEDNEAVIKMIIKGRPTMRHVSRTHRVALDWLFDRINLDPKIHIKHIDTKNQLADMLIKWSFTRDEWNHLLCSFNISHFSSAECSEVMSKRTQKELGKERVTAKSRPMMNLIARRKERAPSALSSTASESLVKTRHESQSLLSPQAEKYNRTARPVVCSQRASQKRFSREYKNVILEEENHDRTVRPVVCSERAKLVSEQSYVSKMRSLDWKQLVGKIIHGNTCHWLVMKESSIFNARRSTSFHILFCVLAGYTRTLKQIRHGKTDWRGSKVHRNTESWTELMVSQWNSSGIFSQDNSIRCSSVKNSNVYCWDQMRHQRISQEESSSCRCSTTSHGDQETTRKNASQMLNSCLYLRKDSELDNGHSSDLDRRKSGILSVQIVHKENGREDDFRIRRKRTPSLSSHESIVQRSAQEQRWWKIVDTLLCRPGNG